ncbi:MAG: PIG-L family deacetylase [Bacteroidales bacterium]|jgi:LmbE family N-acetylglucosaminyl deacetylase|nr:PIG-L family deacetylase [Bacteroidales bacterium]
MISNSNNILVLAPHTDDGELGAGGTINRLVEQGKNVVYVAFSTAELSVPAGFPKDILKKEVKIATGLLGVKSDNLLIYNYEVRKLNYVRQEILEELIKIKQNWQFDLVFIPSLHDIHQDHTIIAQEGVRAFKNTTLLGYELIWNNLTFNTQCFIKLEKRHIDVKINALKAYKSQGIRNYLSPDFIVSLAKSRGVQIGCEYAEAFEVIRLFL